MASGQLIAMQAPDWMQTCILLAPSPANAGWIAAIESRLRDRGRRLQVILNEVPTPPPSGEDQPVYLAFQPEKLAPSPAAERGLVLATAGTVALVAGGDNEEAIRRASVIYAGHALWTAGTVVTERNLANAGEDGVEILPGLWVKSPDFSAWRSHPLTDRVQPALAPYLDGLPLSGAQAEWTTGVLLDKSQRDRGPSHLAGTIDLTGRPRQLLVGPYYRLTPGVWRMRFEFSLLGEGSGDFRIEWGEPGRTVHLVSNRLSSGRYVAILEQSWAMAGEAEIVVESLNARLSGELRLEDVRIQKTS